MRSVGTSPTPSIVLDPACFPIGTYPAAPVLRLLDHASWCGIFAGGCECEPAEIAVLTSGVILGAWESFRRSPNALILDEERGFWTRPAP